MSNFTTKARTIELLGRKQLRDSVTALAELMKNAYDADAEWLRVTFNTKKNLEDLIIADMGCGMSKSDIENKWLVLGTNSKTSSKIKTSPSGRPLMGAKGIGRLASAKLGKHLWLFTKQIDGDWNIVFINWDIFENPYLSIEDINIPTKYGVPQDELIARFDSIISELVEIQKENIKLKSWYDADTDYSTVKKDLSELYDNIIQSLSNEQIIQDNVKTFFSIKKGTILYIDNLNDNWAHYLKPQSSSIRKNDIIAEKMFSRFATFVSAFKNTKKIGPLPFEVEVFIDSQIWAEDFSYTDEDYNYYDIKIEGTVFGGVFKGELDATNADKALLEEGNRRLAMGIPVTSGISNWREIECGKYSIKFCHLEGSKKASGLSPDEYTRIRRKLEIAGGASVYRDGVRVLPYGEPENDFMNLEERRSQNAGFYIFSHRNLFGRIDINSSDNPLLEDKSSREGLIENNQYHYFIKTLENLLTDIAFDFLSTARKDSINIRASYIKKNKEISDSKLKNIEREKEDNAEANLLIKEVKLIISKNQKEVNLQYKKYNDFCHSAFRNAERFTSANGYNFLQKEKDRYLLENQKLFREINEWSQNGKLNIPKKFLIYFNDDLLHKVENNNVMVSLKSQEYFRLLDENKSAVLDIINKAILKWEQEATGWITEKPEKFKQTMLARLTSIIESVRTSFSHITENILLGTEHFSIDLAPVEKQIMFLKNYETYLWGLEETNSVNVGISRLEECYKSIETLFDQKPNEITEFAAQLLEDIEKRNNDVNFMLNKLNKKQEQEILKLHKMTESLIRAYQLPNMAVIEDDIIGDLKIENAHLRSEMDIYSDLANLGLASEIVSHEFNQLFTNVHHAIANLSPYINDPNAKYWLTQINVGFKSISDRQNQLSPMYRSYSLRKRNVNLHEFINEICRFMEAGLKRDRIVIINDVSTDVIVNFSPSKIFPAISNIINNAMYWVLDQDEKVIQFRFDEVVNCLFIEDSGSGIKSFERDRIFDPFISYKPKGRGLGLTIVKKVLESQNFSIEIAGDNEKILPGACFKICFGEMEKYYE